MCSLGANLRMNSETVKQNDRCFPQSSPIAPPFRDPATVAKLEERDQKFPRESEDISQLGRHIDGSGDQRFPESGDHRFEHTSVIVAIRLHLDDSPLPLQKSKQTRNRAPVA